MGAVAKVLEFVRRIQDGMHYREVVADPGGGANKSYEYYQGSGSDCPPLPTDDLATQPGAGAGVEHAIGVNDPKNAGDALDGEVHWYGRTEDGTPIGHFRIRRDGTVQVTNEGGTITLTPSGICTVQTTAEVHLDTPLVKLTDSAGREVARRGDPVVVRVPPMIASTFPVLPVTGSPTPGGAIAASGQIIAGDPKTLVSG